MPQKFSAHELRDWARHCAALAENPEVSAVEKARLDRSRAELSKLADQASESEPVLVEFILPEEKISVLG